MISKEAFEQAKKEAWKEARGNLPFFITFIVIAITGIPLEYFNGTLNSFSILWRVSAISTNSVLAIISVLHSYNNSIHEFLFKEINK